MPESHDLIHCVEHDRMFKHSIVIELAQIFDFCDTSLVELEIILLQPEVDRLDDIVDHRHSKIRVVSVDGTQENRQDVDAAVLDFTRFRKNLGDDRYNLQESLAFS